MLLSLLFRFLSAFGRGFYGSIWLRSCCIRGMKVARLFALGRVPNSLFLQTQSQEWLSNLAKANLGSRQPTTRRLKSELWLGLSIHMNYLELGIRRILARICSELRRQLFEERLHSWFGGPFIEGAGKKGVHETGWRAFQAFTHCEVLYVGW